MDYKPKYSTSSRAKVDVHHHPVPPFWLEEVQKANVLPKPLPWSLELTEAFMGDVGTTTTVLSLTTPGVGFFEPPKARDMARRVNEWTAELRDSRPGKIGFFATIPPPTDIEGAIEEAKYALTVLKAEGITLFTRYGNDENRYLGHESFRPLWKVLDELKAVVFIHPCAPKDTTPFPATLVTSISEFPHETTRTALDLIFTNTKRDFPNCKVILSHAGGTLPYLAARASFMEIFPASPLHKPAQEIWDDMKSFYYDLAMAGHENTLNTLLGFIPHDHILYGSDYPYARRPGILRMNDGWEGYPVSDKIRDMINFENAQKILPMFSKQ
ncbi:hypothetical protein LTS17_000261 [Exophiala oligosperma]